MTTIGLRQMLHGTFDNARALLPEVLKTEGFGILTEIDVKKTLKEKIDVDFRRYTIFGACNPRLAHEALSTEIELGLLLPCNVVLYEEQDGRVVALAVDPVRTVGAVGVEVLNTVAADVRARLERVLKRLEAATM